MYKHIDIVVIKIIFLQILDDFQQMFPEKANLLHKNFDDFKERLQDELSQLPQTTESQILDDICKGEEADSFLALRRLSSICKPSVFCTPNSKTSKKKHPTMVESRDSFVYFLKVS